MKSAPRDIVRIIALSFLMLVSVFPSSWAMNSLATPETVQRMKAANVSDEVIQMLVAEQTCSVGGDVLIALKEAGANDETLKSVILADRYKSPEKAHLSVRQVELLKKAGFSEEMIRRLIDMSPTEIAPTENRIDELGNERVIRGRSAQPAEERTPSQPLPHLNVFIEKVEQP